MRNLIINPQNAKNTAEFVCLIFAIFLPYCEGAPHSARQRSTKISTRQQRSTAPEIGLGAPSGPGGSGRLLNVMPMSHEP